jgi:hypothetical protein
VDTVLRRPRRLGRTGPSPAELTGRAPGQAPSSQLRGWHHGLRGALLGALAGATWGIAARVWMRLVATDPSFSWSGTLFILAIATLSGTLLGLALAGRDGRHPRLSRAVGVAGILPLGMGAGVVLLPAIVAATFAVPGRPVRLPARLLAAGVPCLGLLAVGLDGSTPRWITLGLVGFVVLGAVEATFRPLMALYAMASLALVVVPMFDGNRSTLRAAVVSLLYVFLLLPPTLTFHGAVRGRAHHHLDRSATADRREPVEATS